jgi:DNA topoisomerase VI subunit B
MDYAVRVYILKNTTVIPCGHAFIELKSPTGSKYYELNSNDNFPKAFSL